MRIVVYVGRPLNCRSAPFQALDVGELWWVQWPGGRESGLVLLDRVDHLGVLVDGTSLVLLYPDSGQGVGEVVSPREGVERSFEGRVLVVNVEVNVSNIRVLLRNRIVFG